MDVEALDRDGHGMAQTHSRTLRIRNALPGEAIVARMLGRRGGEWRGEAVTIAGTSPERVSPACPYFPRCGGCAMQHVSYEAQLKLKKETLLDALAAHRVSVERVMPVTTGPRFHYRSRARLGVRRVGSRVLVGFREGFSSRVARMSACAILSEPLARLPGALGDLIGGLSRPERVPQVEVAAGDDAAAMILRHLEPLTAADTERLASFARMHRLRCYTQSGGYDTVRDVAGAPPYLGYANVDYGLHFLFRPTDFTQVNLAMNRKLVRAALAGLAAPPGSRVLDLFCGIGNFSLPLAASGLRVRGFEASAEAVDRARLNAARNGLGDRCEFAVEDLYDADCLNLGQAEYVLLDPPRSGAGGNLAVWLRRSGARRVAYVSCSPASFAADAAVLNQAGFVLEQVGVFDMFPHTAHVETLGIFRLGSS
ncbi:MAG: 23S rRNA (uracil(1939)-C(5))-methyltransferase RlmD [Pseudomonadales bacterium]